jgi:hypothetical protein
MTGCSAFFEGTRWHFSYQEAEEDGSGEAGAGRSRSPVFAIVLALLHRLFQFLLVAGKESMNLAMRFAADSVNLRIKLLPRRFRIFIEQCLNLIVVLI